MSSVGIGYSMMDVSIKSRDTDYHLVGYVKAVKPSWEISSVAHGDHPTTAPISSEITLQIVGNPYVVTTRPIMIVGVSQDPVDAHVKAAEKLPVLLLQDIVCRKLRERIR